jgi:hypothetical protein
MVFNTKKELTSIEVTSILSSGRYNNQGDFYEKGTKNILIKDKIIVDAS